MAENKYYTIAEISDLLSISQSNLRYLEKSLHNLKVKKIRGRRYYSIKNLEILQNKLSKSVDMSPKPLKKEIQVKEAKNTNLMEQIIVLEKKFFNLQAKLES
jgi:DNA-binding transcriptional MerR regulator